MTTPLVTVGIPTFNRPKGLSRTLTSICGQSYRNLEIIVSDNASSDPAVRETVDEFTARDNRVSYHRHAENLGAMANFSSLVPKGSGSFFMWAADDDRWEPFFIERCVAALKADPSLVVCQMESQYELVRGGVFPYFSEGAPFHDYSSASPVERVKHLLRHVYGNLVYGVYRRQALFQNGRPITEWIGRSLNEIPMLILVAARGGLRVIPEVGLYKSAPQTVCERARWEQIGGLLPSWRGWQAYVTDFRSLHIYHSLVMRENFAAIDSLGYDQNTTRRLRAWAAYFLRKHELLLALRWKPSVFGRTSNSAVVDKDLAKAE